MHASSELSGSQNFHDRNLRSYIILYYILYYYGPISLKQNIFYSYKGLHIYDDEVSEICLTEFIAPNVNCASGTKRKSWGLFSYK
jgi:hypothetical protein